MVLACLASLHGKCPSSLLYGFVLHEFPCFFVYSWHVGVQTRKALHKNVILAWCFGGWNCMEIKAPYRWTLHEKNKLKLAYNITAKPCIKWKLKLAWSVEAESCMKRKDKFCMNHKRGKRIKWEDKWDVIFPHVVQVPRSKLVSVWSARILSFFLLPCFYPLVAKVQRMGRGS